MKICIFTSFLLVFLLGGCQINPVTGEEEFNLFSVEQQEKMGVEYAKQVEKEFGKSITDLQMQNYIDSVGQKIAGVCHTPDEGFQYKAIDHNSVNAFALPGGYIYITTGMLKELDSEAQLAAILAHETAHVTARHSAVTMSREYIISIGASAVSKYSTAAGRVADVVASLEGMRYSRSHERQADKVGLDYLVKAGYSPAGMVETMEILQKQSTKKTIEFLSTHPSPENRIGYIQQDIYNKNYGKYYKTGRIGKEGYQKNITNRLDLIKSAKEQK